MAEALRKVSGSGHQDIVDLLIRNEADVSWIHNVLSDLSDIDFSITTDGADDCHDKAEPLPVEWAA